MPADSLTPLSLADIVALLTFVVACATLWKALHEYKAKVARERMELLITFRKRFKENQNLRAVALALETPGPSVAEIPYEYRRDFGGFIEEIALALNAGLLPKPETMALFQYFMELILKSAPFWHDMEPTHEGWRTLKDLAGQMGISWPPKPWSSEERS